MVETKGEDFIIAYNLDPKKSNSSSKKSRTKAVKSRTKKSKTRSNAKSEPKSRVNKYEVSEEHKEYRKVREISHNNLHPSHQYPPVYRPQPVPAQFSRFNNMHGHREAFNYTRGAPQTPFVPYNNYSQFSRTPFPNAYNPYRNNGAQINHSYGSPSNMNRYQSPQKYGREGRGYLRSQDRLSAVSRSRSRNKSRFDEREHGSRMGSTDQIPVNPEFIEMKMKCSKMEKQLRQLQNQLRHSAKNSPLKSTRRLKGKSKNKKTRSRSRDKVYSRSDSKSRVKMKVKSRVQELNLTKRKLDFGEPGKVKRRGNRRTEVIQIEDNEDKVVKSKRGKVKSIRYTRSESRENSEEERSPSLEKERKVKRTRNIGKVNSPKIYTKEIPANPNETEEDAAMRKRYENMRATADLTKSQQDNLSVFDMQDQNFDGLDAGYNPEVTLKHRAVDLNDTLSMASSFLPSRTAHKNEDADETDTTPPKPNQGKKSRTKRSNKRKVNKMTLEMSNFNDDDLQSCISKADTLDFDEIFSTTSTICLSNLNDDDDKYIKTGFKDAFYIGSKDVKIKQSTQLKEGRKNSKSILKKTPMHFSELVDNAGNF